MPDGDALIIGAVNNGIQITQLLGDTGEYAVGLEVLTPGDATIQNSAAIVGRSEGSRAGVLGVGSPGLVGRASQPGQPAVLGHTDDGGVGVIGHSDYGTGVASSPDAYGVIGIAGNVGVYAQNSRQHTEAYLGAPSAAGDFYGGVYVRGFLTKSGGGFQIDHPQHPAESISFMVSSSLRRRRTCTTES
jgi:hypothetical protein